MTKYVSLTDAKASLSEVIEDVIRGEEVVVTKHGNPVVKMTSFTKPTLIFGSLEGQLEGWEDVDFDDTSHMDEAWAIWREKLARLGE